LAALGSQTFVSKILDDAETPFKPITYRNTISASAKKFENCHPNRLIRKANRVFTSVGRFSLFCENRQFRLSQPLYRTYKVLIINKRRKDLDNL
jgi:hypothetical protein